MKKAKTIPLDELELFDLVCGAYPERFDEDEADMDKVHEFIIEQVQEYDGLVDFLGRLVMHTAPTRSPLTGSLFHMLGEVAIRDGMFTMKAYVKRIAYSHGRADSAPET